MGLESKGLLVRRGLVIVGAVALCGCASARILPAGVTGNAEFVSVSNVWGVKDALPYAEKHCANYGKVAKLQKRDGASTSFDCVKPAG